MTKLACRLSEQLIKHNNRLEKTRLKMESLLVSRYISFSDIESVYSGLYLSLFNQFEVIIEELFIGLLSGKYYSKTQNIQCMFKIKPIEMTQDVIFGGRNYLDWLPYKDFTITRAKRFFTDGKPFTNINDIQRNNLKDYCVIRNAIAHNSDIAQNNFQAMISSLPLLPQERTPAGYLRSIPSPSSPQTQFEIASLELESIAHTLCR